MLELRRAASSRLSPTPESAGDHGRTPSPPTPSPPNMEMSAVLSSEYVVRAQQGIRRLLLPLEQPCWDLQAGAAFKQPVFPVLDMVINTSLSVRGSN